MARRIELPSADELFGNSQGAPRSKAAVPAKTKKATPPKKKGAAAKAKPSRAAGPKKASAPATKPTRPAATKGAAQQPRRRAPADVRLADIESRLAEMPVGALIDLRDGLEDLLAADTLDERAVRRLLDSFAG